MDSIKPRINIVGYRKALQEYGQSPSRIVEELVANSYDADATVVFIVHSDHSILVVDNGTGISDEQFPHLLDLGAGSKIGAHASELRRSYLGSFGFGIKAMINIAKAITIVSTTKSQSLACDIDVPELESKGFKEDWPGFPILEHTSPRSSPKGTAISLSLKSALTPEDIESIEQSLYNLPKAKDFAIYLISRKKAGKQFSEAGSACIAALRTDAKKFKKDRISGRLDIGTPKTIKCTLTGSDTIDVAVWCNGLDANMKVDSLQQFAGVYVKVDGRVLKRNFQGEKILDGISKYPKFKHGMRIEVPIDWVKQQISLGRDGLQFGNDSSKRKFENELKSAVSAAVKPFAQQLQSRKLRKASREATIRMNKAEERIEKKQAIKALVSTGFHFVPTDDYEMALLIANPAVLKKVCPSWILMDFNGQLDFDCLIYDTKTTLYKKVELEPKLANFLGQAIPDNTDCIVAWTRGDWKVGKSKKGKRGWYELIDNTDGFGHYKLLIKPSEKSRKPKQALPVFCLDKVVKH